MTSDDTFGDLSPKRQKMIDQLCDHFESRLSSDKPPRIEAYLGKVKEEFRAIVLRELLVLEVEHIKSLGGLPDGTDYKRRFRKHEELINSVCGEDNRETNENADHTIASKSSAAKKESKNSKNSIGRYHLQERLGAGAFGTVFRAFDPKLDRSVALKVPHRSVLSNPGVVNRFHVEAKAAARLKHPNIVPVYDADTDGKRHYIASAFIEGETLESSLDFQRMDYRETAEIVYQLAIALDYAHRKGIVHRDVKPSNIMLDHDGKPHLMDFGLARLEDSVEKLTQDGNIMGTPAYMSPEQARGEVEDVSPASDQYSLGATLYEMLCGEIPFSGPAAIVLYNINHGDVVKPTNISPKIPRDLETICLKAMQKSPERRYESCKAFAGDIRRWLRGEPIQARPVGIVERTISWVRRNRVISGLAGTAAVLLLTLVIVWPILRSREESAQIRADLESEAKTREQARANKNEELVNTQRARASTAETVAIEERESKEEVLYDKNIPEALKQWELGNVERSRELLAECPVRLRNWEHAFLNGLLNKERTKGAAHSDWVWSVAFSPDGSKVLSASDDRTIKLWSTETSHELRSWKLTTMAPVRAKLWGDTVAFGPKGSVGVHVALQPFAIYSLDLETGNQRKKLEYPGTVSMAFVSSDGKWMAIAQSDTVREEKMGKIIVSEFTTNRGVTTIDTPPGIIQEVDVSADGSKVAAVHYRRGKARGVRPQMTIFVWECKSGREYKKMTIEEPGSSNWRMAWDPHGERLAVVHEKMQLGIWDLLSGEMKTLSDQPYGSFVQWSRDDKWIATSAWKTPGDLTLFDVKRKAIHAQLQAHTDGVACAAFSPDSKQIATGGIDNAIRLWDIEKAETILEFGAGVIATGEQFIRDDPTVYGVGFPLGGEMIFTIGQGDSGGMYARRIAMWSMADGKEIQAKEVTGRPGRTVIDVASEDGSRAILIGRDRQICHVWDTEKGEKVTEFKEHQEAVQCAAISPDGSLAATSGRDNTFVWNVETGQVICPLSYSAVISSAAQLRFSRDGSRIVGTTGSELVCWDSWSGKEIQRIRSDAICIDINPDATLIAAGDDKGAIKLWNVASGKSVATLGGHLDAVHSIAFSPDGMRIVSGGMDHRLRVWNTVTGSELLAMKGLYGSRRNSLAWTPDGEKLLSFTEKVRIWDGSRKMSSK